MIDKPIKDLTPEEREQVIQEMKETATPEELESITQLAEWIGNAGAWLRIAAYKKFFNEIADPETAELFTKGLREFLMALIELLESDDTIKGMTPNEFIKSDKYDEIVKRAANRIHIDVKTLPTYTAHKLEKLDFPLDKVNSNVWKLIETDAKGQLALSFGVEKRGSRKPLDIMYSIDFAGLEDLPIVKKLTAYDKRVYGALAGIYNNGDDITTCQEIYNNMGYTGTAGGSDLNKIDESITKMSRTWLYLNNESEAAEYDYPKFVYDASLLPMERVTAYSANNGQIIDSAIHLFREPPLMTFARERKQFTTITLKLLNGPLNKTAANLELEDYLIEQIARIKTGNRNKKMLYKTIYENTHITEKKQRQRAPAKIKKLLTHYKECNYINDFKITKDGVTIDV